MGLVMKIIYFFHSPMALLTLALLGGIACTPSERTFETSAGAGGGGGSGSTGQNGSSGTGGSDPCSNPDDCPPIENPPIQISAGLYHTCAIRKDGSLWCWGGNGFGEIGVPGAPAYPIPVAVPLPGKAMKVAAGGGFNPELAHTCVLLEDTTVFCWGAGEQGQLGAGSATSANTPQKTVSLVNIIDISAGGHHTCAVKDDGALLCWGDDASGQIGNGPVLQDNVATPETVFYDVKRVGAGQEHTCAIAQDTNALFCWGWNLDSQLGNGTSMDQHAPLKVSAPLTSMVDEVALGDRHTCARKGNEVYCFGNDYNGAVGVNSFGKVPMPTLVAVPGVTGIDTGRERSGAIYGESGGLMMWGVSVLGDGSSMLSGTPVDVKQLTGVVQLAAGYDHTCALLATGEVLCWGENDHGQLGNDMAGPTEYLPVAVQFPTNSP
jgi:alpha-tubulin suppressor-like RCC1 family protein